MKPAASHVVDQHGGKVQFLRRRSESRHPSNQNETPGEFAATINIPFIGKNKN
jgi:hypothetical protein